jgi:hypothetical protein
LAKIAEKCDHIIDPCLWQVDVWGFGGRRASVPQNVARMPVERDSDKYNMNHKRRGLAIIFNHREFDPKLGLKTRDRFYEIPFLPESF